MDYPARVTVTIAVGILVGLFYTRRTGWGTGGLVTPGLLALQASSPFYLGGALCLGVLFAWILRPVADRLSLYGRERVGAALLIALLCRLAFSDSSGLDAFWIGWIAPGLIACDVDRQGVAMTLAGAASTAVVTAFVVFGFVWFGSFLA